jgi:hypothetical protein
MTYIVTLAFVAIAAVQLPEFIRKRLPGELAVLHRN